MFRDNVWVFNCSKLMSGREQGAGGRKVVAWASRRACGNSGQKSSVARIWRYRLGRTLGRPTGLGRRQSTAYLVLPRRPEWSQGSVARSTAGHTIYRNVKTDNSHTGTGPRLTKPTPSPRVRLHAEARCTGVRDDSSVLTMACVAETSASNRRRHTAA